VATIRRATMADAAQIAEAHVRSWQSAYRGLIPQDYLDGLDPANRTAMWARILASVNWRASGVLVAEMGSAVAGFISFGPTRDDDDNGHRLIGEIMAIYVAPPAWGNGVGRELMTAALDRLAAVGYVDTTLWVLKTNLKARRFYEAAGFMPDGQAKEDKSRGFALHEVRYRRSLH
jgi:RimJ/RimL family protein N-acetyltransferase